uniref:Spindle pole body component n=1 Tax=Angomonas deanei TaxID=59799 RepID=C6K3S4_9TRYP|nr:conserved hypothetical protein [Angomonas deanei]
MEEVKCCLLGFHSEILEQALQSAPSSSGSGAAVPTGSEEAADARLRAFCESLPFHPTEQALLQRVLPLGRSYHVLQRAAQAVAVGRTEGLYPSAIENGIRKILQHYVEAVKSAATPSALAALPATYAITFSLLEKVVQAQQQVEACLPLLDRFLHHQEVPALFRRLLGESVWLSILYTTAHYVAHGVVLHARPDYFVSLQPKPAGASPAIPARGTGSAATATASPSTTTARASSGEEHTLYVDRLPRGVSTDLGLLILAAGKERRVLLRDADVQGGGDYLEQLALGSQDEAANAVFHSIFNVQLCQGGVLAAEELAARVEAAKTLWSKALWMKVGDLPALRQHLAALRNVFLCHRGDIWYAFVERVLPVFASANPQQPWRPGTAAIATSSSSSSAAAAAAAARSSLPLPATPPMEGDALEVDQRNEEDAEDDNTADARTAAARAAAARCAFLQRTAADAFLSALSISNVRDTAPYETFSMRVSATGVEQADEAFTGDRSADTKDVAGNAEGEKRGGARLKRRVVRSASTEDMAKHLLRLVQSMYVQYIPPQGLPLIVSPKSMQYYQRLLSLHLSLRFSLQALAITRALFSEALVTNAKPSADLRHAFTLFHLLQFLESTMAYYMQVDVISVCTAKLEEQLTSTACASVEQAKRLHDQFIWSVSEAAFLTEGSEALLRACQALNTCAVTLYTLCTRYRIPYWAVEGVNETPIEVRATLSALEVRVQQDVVAVFTGHLALGGRQWERALWSRMDFSKFFSQHRTRASLPTPMRSSSSSGMVPATAASTTFAQPSATRTRSSGVGARSGGGGAVTGAATATTPRRLRSSSKRAGGGGG